MTFLFYVSVPAFQSQSLEIICTENLSSVPVNSVVCQLMMYSNVIVGITISRGSFVFSQSRVKVSVTVAYMRNLSVEAFDLVNCSSCF